MSRTTFSARLDYGINLKSLVPDLTSEDVENVMGNIRKAHEKVSEVFKSNKLTSVLKFVTIGNSFVENDPTADIIFYFNNEIEVNEEGLSLTKEVDFGTEENKSTFECECLLLLTEIGYPQTEAINARWILSLKEY